MNISKKIKNDYRQHYLLTLKKKLQLKAKVNNILREYNHHYCQEFIDKTNEFNRKVWDYSSSKPFVELQITKSKKFNFEKTSKPWNIHYMNTSNFIPNYNKIKQNLIKKLTPKEIEMIRKDVDFYIKDKNIINNIEIFENETLCKRLNNEENNIVYPLEPKVRSRNVIKVMPTQEYSEHFQEERYLKKLINQSKEKDKLNKLKEQKKNTFINKVILKTKYEFLNCDREMKEKHDKILLTLTKKSSDLFEKKNKQTLSPSPRAKNYKKIQKLKVPSIEIFHIKSKSSFTQNSKNNELAINSLIKQYSDKIKNNFLNTNYPSSSRTYCK